jgi:hypothetical protein
MCYNYVAPLEIKNDLDAIQHYLPSNSAEANRVADVSDADMYQFFKQRSQTQHAHLFTYLKLLEATLPVEYHEINPNSLLRSPVKMGGAFKNKFLALKIVSSNMFADGIKVCI